MAKDFKLDKELYPLLLLRMPKNVFLIRLSNLLVRFLYVLKKPEKGVTQKRIQVKMRDGGVIHIDIFTPDQLLTKETLLYFPGGGFMMPGTHIHKKSLSYIANKLGMKTFMVHYRLAPKYPFPTAFYDAIDSYKYIKENASQFDILEDRIGLGGDSAGGNLAAGLSLYLKDEGMILPPYQLLLYPALDKSLTSRSRMTYTFTPMFNSKMLKFVMKHYYKNGLYDLEKYTFPCVHPSLKGLEPTYIEILEYDPLHDDGVCFTELLKQNQVEVLLRDIKHAVHGYDAMAKASVVRDSIAERINFIKSKVKE